MGFMARVSGLSVLILATLQVHAGSAGWEMQTANSGQKFSVGPVDPKVQTLVNQFQSWAMQRYYNENTPPTMIAVPTADPSKKINGGTKPQDQQYVNNAAAIRAKGIGYNSPLHMLMGYKIGYLLTIGDFMQKSDEFITKNYAHSNPQKAAALISAKNILRANVDGKLPVEAKVLGPVVMENMANDPSKIFYCKTVTCSQDRMKVSVMIFGSAIEKIAESGVLDAKEIESLSQNLKLNYYFVQINGQWVFEEAPVMGNIGLMKTVN